MLDIDAFHFLRPMWLWLIVPGVLVIVAWHISSDPRTRWRGIIAPHLLDRLIVNAHTGWRLRPVHIAGAALALIGLAAAGPTWEKEPPPFTEDKAPMMIVIDLSPSMEATDVPPTRLERAKQKVRDLMQARAGSRTGLIVYAGTAHLVLPPTDDAAMMTMFLDALSPSLLPRSGKNAVAALEEADKLLGRETVPGTIVFITDGFDTSQIPTFAAHQETSAQQLLVLAVGTEAGGPVRAPDGRVVTDARGRPVFGRFDIGALQTLASRADIPLASITLDDEDIRWVQRRALSHLQEAEERNAKTRWREAGYWLCFPMLLLGLMWFRRGWVVRWLPALLVAILVNVAPRPAQAAEWRPIDAFMTHDQQGRWQYDHGRYKEAAALFDDAMWRGWAYYRAADYNNALTAFANMDSPDAFFMMGNCYARLGDYPKAIAAYDNALEKRADFSQAKTNRALIAALMAQKKTEDEGDPDAPHQKPDEIKFDDKAKHGKETALTAKEADKLALEMWMRNLQTTPADFLRQKFAIEDQAPTAGTPSAAKKAPPVRRPANTDFHDDYMQDD